MSDEPKPLSDDEVRSCETHIRLHHGLSTENTLRLIATIRDRDKLIESLESQVQTLEHWILEQGISTEARRAEALILYNSFIARGWGDGDKAAFASRAEAAIVAAAVFNEKWEKRND